MDGVPPADAYESFSVGREEGQGEEHTDHVTVSLQNHERPLPDTGCVGVLHDFLHRKVGIAIVLHQGEVGDESGGFYIAVERHPSLF